MHGLLTNIQIAVILFAAIFGYGIINLPSDIADVSGTGGWITLLLTTVIFVVITFMVAYIQYTHENMTLYDYTKELFGKFIAAVLTLAYALYFFIIFSMVARLYTETIKLIFLATTPTWALLILYYGTVIILLTKNLRSIARLSEIYISAAIISYIFVIITIFINGEIINMRPFVDTSQIINYVKAVKNAAIPFLGMEILFSIPFSKKGNKNIFKYIVITIGIVGVLYILIFEASISVKGIESIMERRNTTFQIIRATDIPFLEFLRRLDGFFFVFWTANIFCSTSIWAYGTTAFINKIFPQKSYGYISVFVIIAAFVLSLLPQTVQQVEKILKYITQLSLVYLIIIPIIILITMKVKKNEKKSL